MPIGQVSKKPLPVNVSKKQPQMRDATAQVAAMMGKQMTGGIDKKMPTKNK